MLIRIIGYYNPPKLGIARYMDELIPRLSKQLALLGHKIELITNNGLASNCDFKFDDINSIQIIPYLNRSISTILWMLFKLPIYDLKHPADVTLFLANPLAVPSNHKTICVIHDLNEFDNPKKYGRFRSWYRRNLMLRMSVATANALVAISSHTYNQIHRHLGSTASKKTRVIPNGIPASSKLEASTTIPHKPYLLTVGRLDPDGKNLREALELFRQLRNSQHSLSWVLVGGFENPMDKNKISIFLQELDTEPQVQCLGYVSRQALSELYCNATATLFYSKQEGFGFPLLEAFSHGCPVITHPENAAAKEVGGGLDIPIAPDANRTNGASHNILNKIKSIDRKTLIHHAQGFDWEATAVVYANFILEIASEARRRPRR